MWCNAVSEVGNYNRRWDVQTLATEQVTRGSCCSQRRTPTNYWALGNQSRHKARGAIRNGQQIIGLLCLSWAELDKAGRRALFWWASQLRLEHIQVPLSDKVIKQSLPLLQMLRLTRVGDVAWARLLSVIRVICVVSITIADRRETFSSLCVLLSAAPRREIYLYEMFWCPQRSRWGHNRVNLSHCHPNWSECCYFHPAHVSSGVLCGQSEHRMARVAGSGVRGYCRSLRVTRRCCYAPDSNITPTLQHPAINSTLGGDMERAETWAVWLPVTWPIWLVSRRQKRCFHLRIYVSS